jgi:hypothetical protein
LSIHFGTLRLAASHNTERSRVAYCIGTDEAGYGPNLGPLVVSATVWEVPDGTEVAGLYNLLCETITAEPRRTNASGPYVAMADSKRLYQPGKGLRLLERGLLGALAAIDRLPTSWTELTQSLSPAGSPAGEAAAWYPDDHPAVPAVVEPAEIERLGRSLCEGLTAKDVRLADVRSRPVFPEEFNRMVDEHQNKAAALSHLTLGLAAGLIAALPDGPITVICDKHGGRNRYLDLLAEHFPDGFIEIHGEGRVRSVYRFGPAGRRIEFRFEMKAESYLPTALASMASKYVRELAMHAFNAFWCGQVPGLAPTAGYPADAKRFQAAIATKQVELGIDERSVWRSR